MESPRILVEGGPVHRRVNRVLAVMIGLLIGVLPVLGYVGVEAFHAAHDARLAISRLHDDELYTRASQVAGQPISVCLLDVMREVAPLLEREPSVELPLRAYVRLQVARYPGVGCPER